jgi:uncharacterized membrane protein
MTKILYIMRTNDYLMTNIFNTMEVVMPFREKSAWISLLATIGVYGVYFTAFTRAIAAGRGVGFAGPLTACVIALVVVQAGMYIVTAALSPEDARAPEDERERAIRTAARARAFYVLEIAALCAAVTVYFADRTVMATAVVGALVLGEIAYYAGVIGGYRRSA